MPLSAQVVAEVAIYGLVAVSAAYSCALFGLYGEMNALAKYRPDTKSLEPDSAISGNRYFFVTLAWWSWTGAHRDIGDKAISRRVFASRILCIATIAGWIAVFVAPRDFAERAEAWSKGIPYVQQTN